MSKWRYKLEIGDIWQAAENREITPQETARKIMTRLDSLKTGDDVATEKDDVIDMFTDVAKTPDASFDDFDVAMEALYDWGDIPMHAGWPPYRLCWISRKEPKL